MTGDDIGPGGWRSVLPPDEQEIMDRFRRPGERQVDVSRAALLVVDVTPAFVGPNVPVREAQELARTACGERAWKAMPAIQQVLAAWRATDLPVVFTVRDSDQDLITGQSGGDSPLSAVEVVPELGPLPRELVLGKTRASAFFGTPLTAYLVRKRVNTVVICGVATAGCVLASALDAQANGFDVVVVEDASFDRAQLLHDTALAILDAKYAVVEPSSVLVSSLGATAR